MENRAEVTVKEPYATTAKIFPHPETTVDNQWNTTSAKVFSIRKPWLTTNELQPLRKLRYMRFSESATY